MSYDEHELFDSLLPRWIKRGRPSLDETTRMLLTAEAVVMGDVGDVVTKILMSMLSADAELTEQWTTGTDAERIGALLEAFRRMMAALENMADQIARRQT